MKGAPSNDPWRRPRVAASILAAPFLLIGAMSIVSGARAARQAATAEWETVSARVVRVEQVDVDLGGGKHTKMLRSTLAYDIGGQRHDVVKDFPIVSRLRGRQAGSAIDMHVDAHHPKEPELARGSAGFGLGIVGVGVLFALLGMGAAAFAVRDRLRRRDG